MKNTIIEMKNTLEGVKSRQQGWANYSSTACLFF